MNAPARQPAEPAPSVPKPALRVVASCEHCKAPVAEARDRAGRPVRLECDDAGKAVRDPAGTWWAAKVGDRWCVVQPQLGEDPPTSGVRYAEHRCADTALDDLLAPPAPPPAPTVVVEYDPEPPPGTPGTPGTARRSAGRGSGLDGPACREWYRLDQQAPEGGPYHRMCVRCGRVTPRSDGDGLAWCGGALVAAEQGTHRV